MSLAGLVVGIGNGSELVRLMDDHAGIAGWVQAVGSIAAIAAGFVVASRSSADARRLTNERFEEEQRRVGEMEIEALVLISIDVITAVRGYCILCEAGAWDHAQAARLRSIFEGDLGFIDRLNLAAFPDRDSAGLALALRGSIVTMISLIEVLKPLLDAGAQPPTTFGAAAKASAERMMASIASIPTRRP